MNRFLKAMERSDPGWGSKVSGPYVIVGGYSRDGVKVFARYTPPPWSKSKTFRGCEWPIRRCYHGYHFRLSGCNA
jgi:hypothetical protein